jgi:hypothetical protein
MAEPRRIVESSSQSSELVFHSCFELIEPDGIISQTVRLAVRGRDWIRLDATCDPSLLLVGLT